MATSPPIDKQEQGIRNKDTGMILALALAIYCYTVVHQRILLALIAVLVLVITLPSLFALPAKAWFRFSEIVGTFMSKIILTLVFFLLITPLGVIRRLFFTADPLRLQLWKNGQGTVFRELRRQPTANEFERPY